MFIFHLAITSGPRIVEILFENLLKQQLIRGS